VNCGLSKICINSKKCLRDRVSSSLNNKNFLRQVSDLTGSVQYRPAEGGPFRGLQGPLCHSKTRRDHRYPLQMEKARLFRRRCEGIERALSPHRECDRFKEISASSLSRARGAPRHHSTSKRRSPFPVSPIVPSFVLIYCQVQVRMKELS
jgi:hypothetical protein